MRIAIVTDAWAPQVNGVVRTLEATRTHLLALGHQVLVIAPDAFASLPCPTYPEIRLALAGRSAVGRRLAAFAPHAIHIATEGPLGLAARRWCGARALPFTTAYHTQFPDYVAARTGVDPEWVWRYVRWFHAAAQAVLVSTPTIAAELHAHGLAHTRLWGRGVDLACFAPSGPIERAICALPGPVLLYVGRVAVEKNLDAFLSAPVHASKVVIGDGPALASLQQRFPAVHFLGRRSGDALAAVYRSADAFVFPSRTDTFGLVMIEAIACGTPVAAYPVAGPIDVLTAETGAMHADLPTAIRAALTLDRHACAAAGARFTWTAATEQFLAALQPIAPAALAA
ncbi:glycosyltransferase family 4 protein [Sphingomonas sp. Mn802worker]|uniref:glycosyltransferase family 4 protein n=1 Tax=Sphingomonas sp. Mn802worker TaxID=629773 RepID=UPI0003683F52|nr:glycosyltransferase family 1 protein [Sphingomonas sp. Mn802worker]